MKVVKPKIPSASFANTPYKPAMEKVGPLYSNQMKAKLLDNSTTASTSKLAKPMNQDIKEDVPVIPIPIK